ncbi:hypothetical protein [Maritalea sp. S77]|uniref:hypothetical protein n=1 Tax=Maritalea sp. S77 TaxID=3415125 RepID=UPI003C7C9E99
MNVLIYSIHRTEAWWRHIGKNLGFENSFVVSDLRGEGDFCVVDAFNARTEYHYREKSAFNDLLTEDEIDDVIARCRLLRFLPRRRAVSMILAMSDAFSDVLQKSNPAAILSFPIDRYVSDVLKRVAQKRNIPFYELTASAFPDMAMLMQRGDLVSTEEDPTPELVSERVKEIVEPLFLPSYVSNSKSFGKIQFLRTFLYFRARAIAFKAISIWKRDRFNLHYLDAQSFLGHKPKITDIRILDLTDDGWEEQLTRFPKEKRVFFGLQLFPEASIDYWIEDRDLIAHERLIFEAVKAFSEAGYLVLVKDHPLQFGFRQKELIEKILKFENVCFLPYEVSGNHVLSHCGVSFTCTGTLGLQAALMGIKSIVTPNYYSNSQDFILIEDFDQVKQLPKTVEATPDVADLEERRNRIVSNLLSGSFVGEFFSFEGFSKQPQYSDVARFAQSVGQRLKALIE